MGRLSDILARASDAQASLETAVEADVNKYVDRVEQIHKKRENVFMKKHVELDGTVTDLVEFDSNLEAFAKNDRSGSGSGDKKPEDKKPADGDAYVGTSPPNR